MRATVIPIVFGAIRKFLRGSEEIPVELEFSGGTGTIEVTALLLEYIEELAGSEESNNHQWLAQSAGQVEYTDWISADI